MLRQSFDDNDRPPQRKDVIKFLEAIRHEFMEAVKKGDQDVDAVINSLGQRIFRGGLLTIQMSAITYKGFVTAGMTLAAGVNHALNFFGPYKWIFAASIYTAQTGINYRKYKKGEITKKEFKRRAELGAVTVIGGLAGATAGSGAGFLIGAPLGPVGAILGIIIGGIAGGIGGRQASLKIFASIEKKMNRTDALKTVKLDLSQYKTSKFIDGLDEPDDSRMTARQLEEEEAFGNINTPSRQVILSQFEDVIVDEDPFAHIEMC